jgi:hypothetical protein
MPMFQKKFEGYGLTMVGIGEPRYYVVKMLLDRESDSELGHLSEHQLFLCELGLKNRMKQV